MLCFCALLSMLLNPSSKAFGVHETLLADDDNWH